MPGLSPRAAVRGYLNAISIGISLMAPTGRVQDLSDGADADDDLEEIIAGAVRFIAAGLRALTDGDDRTPGREPRIRPTEEETP